MHYELHISTTFLPSIHSPSGLLARGFLWWGQFADVVINFFQGREGRAGTVGGKSWWQPAIRRSIWSSFSQQFAGVCWVLPPPHHLHGEILIERHFYCLLLSYLCSLLRTGFRACQCSFAASPGRILDPLCWRASSTVPYGGLSQFECLCIFKTSGIHFLKKSTGVLPSMPSVNLMIFTFCHRLWFSKFSVHSNAVLSWMSRAPTRVMVAANLSSGSETLLLYHPHPLD